MNDQKKTEVEGTKPPSRRGGGILAFWLLAAGVWFVWDPLRTSVASKTADVSIIEYLELRKAGRVSSAKLTGDRLEAQVAAPGFTRENRTFPSVRVHVPPAYLSDPATFASLHEGLAAGAFSTAPAPGPSFLTLLAVQILPWILILGGLVWWSRRQTSAAGGPGGIFSIGKIRAVQVEGKSTETRFSDVAGADTAKEELQEVVDFLKNPGKFERLGARIPRGILLVGPPGTGKTLLARAVAGEADVPFFSVTGSDFVEMLVGVGASRVRDLFGKAREKERAIIFIDEIDAVGRRRGAGLGGGHDEREQTLNQILVEMDGFLPRQGVVVLAATNRPDVLDPALLRPGRFDRQVMVDLPDVKGREAILKVHARKILLGKDVDFSRIARMTPGLSGADLANLLNEAAILATQRGALDVGHREIEEARDKVLFGRPGRTLEVIEEERRLSAVHESGHALVALALRPHADPVHKVTIVPRARMGGATMFLPEEERSSLSRRRALAQLSVLMGGRVAEELYLDDISTGAVDDIKRATELARAMVTEWGMSGLGAARYSQNEEHLFLGREVARTANVSEVTLREIDLEVRRLLDQAYEEARGILGAHAGAVEKVSGALLEKETIDGDELARLAGKVGGREGYVPLRGGALSMNLSRGMESAG